VSDPSEVAFADVLREAGAHGVRVTLLHTAQTAPKDWQGSIGQLDQLFLQDHVGDYKDRTFYLSGPQAMVQDIRGSLHRLGVKAIKTDYFTGY
jgi:ferredoxin-NADP reductase